MSSANTTTPTRSTEPTAPKYEVSDSLEAWERFDRLVGKVLQIPKSPPESIAPAELKPDCPVQTSK